MSFLGLKTIAKKNNASTTKSRKILIKSASTKTGGKKSISVFKENRRNAVATMRILHCRLRYQAIIEIENNVRAKIPLAISSMPAKSSVDGCPDCNRPTANITGNHNPRAFSPNPFSFTLFM
ncbi:MAG TPA: hypothetical protein VFE98_05165 [Candidatus Bathyarchaeia archaeon]|nr:hypothetical protein [Candidatus Bathyarchaeia archaeon]